MILNLLQLASPALPVGAYSYSEGLETLVEKGVIVNANQLEAWLIQELRQGAIRVEAAIMLRAYLCVISSKLSDLKYWNNWLSASRESSELRHQSWQMGKSLIQLILELETVNPVSKSFDFPTLEDCQTVVGNPCNYAIAFGIGAAHWQIDAKNALLGYLQSWVTNIIGAGVKLIPLGQTTGQKILLKLHPKIQDTTEKILVLHDDELISCSWGLGLASMAHEIQYTRLFRS